jgi:uncharacterized protein with PQ loop repeat
MMHALGLIASVVLPFFNIPLIYRIIQRKSSADISLTWVWGVWIGLLVMVPDGLKSTDTVWRIYNIINFILFSVVVIIVTIYRKKGKQANDKENPGA